MIKINYKRFYSFLVVCFASIQVFAQTPSSVQAALGNQHYVSVLTTSKEAQSFLRHQVVLPLDKIKSKAAEGYFVEEITATPDGYFVLFSKKYTKQLINKGLSYEFIKNGQDKGYALTEISDSHEGPILVMSNEPGAIGYNYLSSSSLTDILSKAKAYKQQLFKISNIKNMYFGLTKPLVGSVDQKIYSSVEFPSSWVSAQVKSGYSLTDFCYSNGAWHLLMTSDPSSPKTEYKLTKDLDMRKDWNIGKRYTRVGYSYDFNAGKIKSKELYTSGEVDFKANRKESAFQKYDQAVSAYPYDYYIYYLRGFRNFYSGRYEAAIKDFTVLLDQFNLIHKEDYYMFRGISYTKTKKYDLAVKDFDQFFKMKASDKDKIMVLDAAIYAHQQLGNTKTALGYIDQKNKLIPQNSQPAREESNKEIEVNKPIIIWDTPFNATSTVSTDRVKISACVYLNGNQLKSYKILLNNKEVPLVGKRGLTIEEVCDQQIEQYISLQKGQNVLQIVLITNQYELHSEKRTINYN